MKFIRFRQLDPNYGKAGLESEAVVQVGQIVKIEPLWSQVKDGEKWLKYVGQRNSEEAILPDTHKEYMVYDSLGNRYSSDDASEEGRQMIEEIWKSAK